MFSLIRLCRNKQPAVIAILAILMLFIAPIVSKTLEHRRMENMDICVEPPSSDPCPVAVQTGPTAQQMQGDDMAGMDMSMPDAMGHEHASMHMAKSMRTAMMPGMQGMMGAGDMMGDIACGYCLVLIHLPLMLCLFAAILWLTSLVSVIPPPKRIHTFFTLFFPGIAQPRAPPSNTY